MRAEEPERDSAMTAHYPKAPEAALQDAIHALAQPLTALSFVLDLALLRSEPEAWKQALEAGRVECRRAIAALQQVRSAAMSNVETMQSGADAFAGRGW